MIYLGIDPGLSGACAILYRDSMVPEVFDTPTLTIEKRTPRGLKTRRDYQISAICQALIQALGEHHDGDEAGTVHAFLESVNAFPGQGVTSMFSLGRGLGIWEGVLAALNIPYTKVLPQVWKRAMLAGMGKAKEASRLRAQQLFPEAELHLKKFEGRAEALLIAEYGRTHLVASKDSLSVCGSADGID